MRLRHSAAAFLLGLSATVAAGAPASAATAPACSFSPTTGSSMVTTTRETPGLYAGNFLYGSEPSCSPYPSLVHWSSTLHITLNGVAQPDKTSTRECSSPDPIMCLPFTSTSVQHLKCDVSYAWTASVSQTGWYQPTAGSAQVTIAPVTGPPHSGTSYEPSACS
jgi:hypothetical protein